MKRFNTVFVVLTTASLLPIGSVLADPPQTETYEQCVARVKRDYPVPPGNVNAQNQMIRDECDHLKPR